MVFGTQSIVVNDFISIFLNELPLSELLANVDP